MSKKERKPLPDGFLDPLNTSRKWHPQGVREIFGSVGDVFGIQKKTTEEDPQDEIEEDITEDNDNEDNTEDR